jgi:hypothetical protein
MPASGWDERSHRCIPREEWEFLHKRHPNVLISGSPTAVSAALGELEPTLQTPVISWSAGNPLPVPSAAGPRTLILNEAGSLTAVDQRRLLLWLRSNHGLVQVLTITSVPLLRLVESGEFDGSLYYVLNVIYLEVFG